MRIAIIGVGGIGGYLGSKLCRLAQQDPEVEVIFIQRGEQFKAIKERGLTYITKTEVTVYPTYISDTPVNAGRFDLVIFNVKSRDLEDSARSISGNIHDETIFISTLNGVNNAARLQNIYPKLRILNGCIYVSAFIEKPGIVRQVGGAGNLYFGPEDGNIESFIHIEEILTRAEIKAVLSKNVTKDVWDKYIFICSWASISSKYKMPVGALLVNDSIKKEWIIIINEIRAVAIAYGVNFEENVWQSCIERAEKLPYDNKTSMQIDIELGKQPEVDIFTGYVARAGRDKGINTPAHNDVLTCLGY